MICLFMKNNDIHIYSARLVIIIIRDQFYHLDQMNRFSHKDWHWFNKITLTTVISLWSANNMKLIQTKQSNTHIKSIILWQKSLPKKNSPKTNQTSPIDKIKIINLSTCLINWFLVTKINQLTVPTATSSSTLIDWELSSLKYDQNP